MMLSTGRPSVGFGPAVRACAVMFAVGAAVLSAPGGLAIAATSTGSDAHHAIVNPRTGLPVGLMPTQAQLSRAATSRQSQVAASNASLAYYGGPVVSNAHIESVLWGGTPANYLAQVAGTTAAPNMDSFFGHVTNSAFVSWLDEYDTNVSGGTSQRIGYGSFLDRRTITPSSAATTIDDPTIQSELLSQIEAGNLASPTYDAAGNPNTVYAVFLPYGTTVCTDSTNCSGGPNWTFCAYHGTTSATFNGKPVYYMVMPSDPMTSAGCGSSSSSEWGNMQSATSHELAETITDPEVGLATTVGPPLAWYDQTNGEIGDICSSSSDQSTVTGTDGLAYTVQLLWSNSAGNCIVSNTNTVPDAPGSLTATPKPGGVMHLSWATPASDGGTAITGYEAFASTSAGTQGPEIATVPATTTSVDVGQLTSGTTYYFSVVAVNVNGPSTGNSQTPGVPDATAPTVSVTSPTRLFQLSTTIHVAYTAVDSDSPSGVRYDVQYRVATWNSGFGSYATLLGNSTATSASIGATPGHEYCIHVRARDTAGNLSAWSKDACTVLPLDDRALSAITTGWSRITASSAYRGTLTTTTTNGAKLRLIGAHTDRIALVVMTCTSCGKIAIYLNGTYWRTVNTWASATHTRVILLPGTFSLRTATIVLANVSAGKRLIIDGIGIART
jgi:Fibronectin type III domain